MGVGEEYLPPAGYELMAAMFSIVGCLSYLVWFLSYVLGRQAALILGFLLSFNIFIPLMYGPEYYLYCMLGQQIGILLIYHGQSRVNRDLTNAENIITLQLTILKEIILFSDLTFKVTNPLVGDLDLNWPIPWVLACSFVLAQSFMIGMEVLKYTEVPPLDSQEFHQNKVTLTKISTLLRLEDIETPMFNCFLSGMAGAFSGVIYARVFKKMLPGEEDDITDAEFAFTMAIIDLIGAITNRLVKVEDRTKDFLVIIGVTYHFLLIFPIYTETPIFYTSKSTLLILSAIVFKGKEVLPVDATMGTINACPSELKTTLFSLYTSCTHWGRGLVLYMLPTLTLNQILSLHLIVACFKEYCYYRARNMEQIREMFAGLTA